MHVVGLGLLEQLADAAIGGGHGEALGEVLGARGIEVDDSDERRVAEVGDGLGVRVGDRARADDGGGDGHGSLPVA